MERKFEEEWRKAMEGAEVQPSGETWLAMESALIALENQRMKRKVVFYQRLAAASVMFALLLGAFGYYSWRNTSPGKPDLAELSQLNQPENHPPGMATEKKNNDVQDIRNADKTAAASIATNPPKQPNTIGINKDRTPDAIIAVLADSITAEPSLSQPVEPTLSSEKEKSNEQLLKQAITAKAEESPIKIRKKKEEPIQVPDVLATTEENGKKENKSEVSRENLWASLSVAAGNYNSGGFSSGNSYAPAPVTSGNTSMSIGGSSVSRSPGGSSRSVGLTLGKRVTRRWVILSGINYLNQTTGYTSNSANQGQAYIANYGSLKSPLSVTFTNPYQINSVLEFLSVPVQAGYLIVDRKLGLQMNAGVSTDFLLRNTLQDPSGQVGSFSQGAGTDSPYRSVNWAGLISTELSYRLAPQYRVSIVPGIRYLFNPVFKSGSGDHPYVTDIGFRFRYILR